MKRPARHRRAEADRAYPPQHRDLRAARRASEVKPWTAFNLWAVRETEK